jgi:hypothetical protein
VKFNNGLIRSKTRALLTAATVTAGVAASVLAGPPIVHAAEQGNTAVQARAGETVWGCEYGYVCIYADTKEFSPITHRYYNYGTYNLQNQFDYHDIVNNQYGHATVTLCYGYNGTNCMSWSLQTYEDCNCAYGINLTPINSIRLNRP